MSSSSDSDDEPVKRITIKIRPKEEAIKADVNDIKNLVQSWRTLGPRSSNSNLSETSSVPIAIAIQESIELIVKGGKQVKPIETRFETRALGNIKVAFPNSFARLGATIAASPVLKLRIHSTDTILRYYANTLIKDLDSETSSLAESGATCTSNTSSVISANKTNANGDNKFLTDDLFDLTEAPMKLAANRTKIIEFDMNALMNQLTQMYQEAPNSRYYNVNALRYQIAPIEKFDQCPLQVCAYWKIEPRLIKLRVDFKHSNQASGFNLDRLRDITFGVDMGNFVPDTIENNTIIPPTPTSNNSTTINQHPYITFEPTQAHWNKDKKMLTWKFDDLSPYYKTDGFGSLLAKLDFRQNQQPILLIDNNGQINAEEEDPKPIEIKFMVVDSTLSKISMSVDSSGYRLSMLKKEIRSARYRSEPYVF